MAAALGSQSGGSASSGSVSKRARTIRVLHEGGVTLRGLQKIAKHLGVGRGFGKHTLRACNRELFDRVRVVESFPLSTGGEFELEMAEPSLLLQELVASSPEMQEVYAQAARLHPCAADTPWSIALGLDEFTPGDRFKPKNHRKVMVTSFNFKELGHALLHHELLWITALCIRSTKMMLIEGGWSSVLRSFLRRMLLGRHSFMTVGVPLKLHGEYFMLYARLEVLLSDADGLRISLDWRGANSIRPCFKCRNVWSRGYGTDDGHVDITCGDDRLFKAQDEATLEGYVEVMAETRRRVQDGSLPNERFKEVQKAFGLNYNPRGVMADAELRRVLSLLKVTRTDWMHDELQDGVFNTECNLFLRACSSKGISFLDWEAYLAANWEFPRHRAVRAPDLAKLFNRHGEEHIQKTRKFKCKASEMLTLYGLLRHYVDVAPPSALEQEFASFKAACDVIDLLVTSKRSGAAGMLDIAARTRIAMRRHHRLHVAAYGTTRIKPKHHLRMHVPEQMSLDNALFDMFVIERHHLRVKAVAEPIDYTGHYERSLMSSLLRSQCNDLASAPQFASGLLGKRANLPGFEGAQMATTMTVDGEYISVDDVVWFAGGPGRVAACASEGGSFYVIVATFSAVGGDDGANNGRFSLTGRVSTWPAERVRCACAWYKGERDWVVLR